MMDTAWLLVDCSGTRSREFAPNVEDEDGGDEDETHHEHGHGSDLEAGRVLGVEAPQTAIVSAAGTGRGRCCT